MKFTGLYRELEQGLSRSDSAARKHWAKRIVDEEIPISQLIPLLHAHGKTGQRFMWLLGDIGECSPDHIKPCLQMLLDLANEMPFPGMPRSVAKWLLLTNVPERIKQQANAQLIDWMKDSSSSIACKSYSAKTLVSQVKQGHVSKQEVLTILKVESNHSNTAFASRIHKLLLQLVGSQE